MKRNNRYQQIESSEASHRVRPRVLLRHEWRRFQKERTLWLLLALFSVCGAWGFRNGMMPALERKQASDFAQNQADEKLASLQEYFERDAKPETTKRHHENGRPLPLPWFAGIVASNWQPIAALPQAPLAPLAVGVSEYRPGLISAKTPHEQAMTSTGEKIENPLNTLTGTFDLSFVVVVLYPLLVIALGYNLLPGEREQSTLALALSYPISTASLLLTKAVPRALAAYAAALGIAGVFVMLAGVRFTDWEVVARFGFWSMVLAAYSAFWWSVVLIVNAFVRSSGTSAIVLALAWLVVVVVTPALSNAVIMAVAPTPARVELVHSIRTLIDAADANRKGILAAHYRAHPELAPKPKRHTFGDEWTVYWTEDAAFHAHVEKPATSLIREFERKCERQRRMAEAARFLSPAQLAQTALSDAAGTGDARHRHFARSAQRFQQEWNAYFRPRILRRESLPSSQWNQVPRFVYREEPLQDLTKRTLWVLTGLLLPTLGLLGVAHRALRRYSVA